MIVISSRTNRWHVVLRVWLCVDLHGIRITDLVSLANRMNHDLPVNTAPFAPQCNPVSAGLVVLVPSSSRGDQLLWRNGISPDLGIGALLGGSRDPASWGGARVYYCHSWEDPYQALYSNPGSSDLSMVPSAYRTEQSGIRKGGYNGTIWIVSNAQSDSPQALTQSRNWTNASTVTPRARAPGQVASG
jgi:hypothetical protein